MKFSARFKTLFKTLFKKSLTWLKIITVTLLLAVVMSALLLFSHTGNVWLWQLIDHRLESLEGELVAGQLWTGWTLKNLRWNDGTIAFSAETVVLKWRLDKLINRQLPIDLLDIQKAHLTIDSDPDASESSASEQQTSDAALAIPVDIFFRDIHINELSLSTGETDISLASLSASGALLNSHLTIDQILADRLHLQINDPINDPIKDSHKKALSIPPLPDITLPFPITLKQLTLTNSLYQQEEWKETINRLSLSFHGQGSTIDGIELAINHRLAEIALTGTIHLDKAWPLNTEIQGRIADGWDIPQLPGLAGQQFSFRASGDLNRLNLTLATQGAVTSSLQGYIEPLVPGLPFDLSLDWQQLHWPLVTNQPQLTASNGRIRLTGSSEHYQLNLKTRLAIPAQPETDLTLSASGNLTQLNITALKIKPNIGGPTAFENPLELSGTLNWQQGIRWQGRARLTRFTPQLLSQLLSQPGQPQPGQPQSGQPQPGQPQISGVIDGEVAMNLALENDNWQLEIPELSLTGTINDAPLNLRVGLKADGLTATPLPQHLTIRHFRAALGDNRLTIAGGVVNEQLGLSAELDVPEPEQFYPGLKGILKGSFALAGHHQHPTLTFHLQSPSLALPAPPHDIIWKGSLSGTGDIRWDNGIPIVNLAMQTTSGQLGSEDLILHYQKLALSLNLYEDAAKARVQVESEQLGIADIDLAVENIKTDQQLSGTLDLRDVQLNVLSPFVPQLTALDGTLAGRARMGGTLKTPLLFGELSLSDGQLTARAEAVKVTHLATRLTVNGNRGELNGSLKMGEGEMKLAGHLDWQQLPLTGLITMKGQQLQAKVPDILQLRVSPDLQLTLGETQKLTGTIVIPWARIEVKELPKQAVTASDDVVIVTPGSEQESDSSHPGPQLVMAVNVVLGSDIGIDAYGLKAELGGQLLLDLKPGGKLTANGSIQLLDGRYHQFGQDLLIKEGNIIFSGPLTSPYLSVDAIRNPDSIEDDVLVGVKVSGSPAQPTFTLYSDPAMEQQEEWSYLLRGRGLEAAEEGDDFAIQSLLIGLGVGQIGGIVSTVGGAIGLSNITLDTQGSGEDTQIVIDGNITRRLRIQYGAGVFNSIARLKIRYELMPQLYLQAVSGVAQTLDLFYRFKIETGKE